MYGLSSIEFLVKMFLSELGHLALLLLIFINKHPWLIDSTFNRIRIMPH